MHTAQSSSQENQRNLYYRSLNKLCDGGVISFKKEIKELLPYLYQQNSDYSIEDYSTSIIIDKILRSCLSIKECEEFLGVMDLRNNPPLFYLILNYLCSKPEQYAELIKKYAPDSYNEPSSWAHKEVFECIRLLVSLSKNEMLCLDLIKSFPWVKECFDLPDAYRPLLHILTEKRFKKIIGELAIYLDPRVTDKQGNTALHEAARQKQDALDLISLLISIGVPALARSKPDSYYPNGLLARNCLTYANRKAHALLLETEEKEKQNLPEKGAIKPASMPLRENNHSPNSPKIMHTLFAEKENDPHEPFLSKKLIPKHYHSE